MKFLVYNLLKADAYVRSYSKWTPLGRALVSTCIGMVVCRSPLMEGTRWRSAIGGSNLLASKKATGTQHQKRLPFRDHRLSKGGYKRLGHHKDSLQLTFFDVRHKTMWHRLGSRRGCQGNESQEVSSPVSQQLTSNHLPLQHKEKPTLFAF